MVEDLATRWIRSYPCKTKTSLETERSRRKKRKSFTLTINSLEFGRSCEELSWNHWHVNTPSIRDERQSWKSGTQNKRRDVCCTVPIVLGWKMVGWSCGMLLPSARCPRPLGRWVNKSCTAIWRTIWRNGYSFWCKGRISTNFCEGPVKAPPIW